MLLNLLLFSVVILAIITSARLLLVFQFAAELRGKKAHEISDSENNMNALLTLLSLVGLFAMFFYLTATYYNEKYIPGAASEHGVEVDSLLNLNFIVIALAFFITQLLLMWFAYKYRYNKKRRATHYAHNDKLEMIWTIVPAIVMAVLVLKGLIVWNHTTNPSPDKNTLNLELYARQFDWTARYSGKDNALGKASYTMINGGNILGLISADAIQEQLTIVRGDSLVVDSTVTLGFLPAEKLEDEKTRLRRLVHQIRTVAEFDYQFKSGSESYAASHDDVLVRDTIILPVNRPVKLHMRSQDVIHSAYLPHFRVHMYCVPGSETYFAFKPITTTKEMKKKLNDPEFEYRLYCNNICGSTHFNMMLPVRVVSEKEYSAWLSAKSTFADETKTRLAKMGLKSNFAKNN